MKIDTKKCSKITKVMLTDRQPKKFLGWSLDFTVQSAAASGRDVKSRYSGNKYQAVQCTLLLFEEILSGKSCLSKELV